MPSRSAVPAIALLAGAIAGVVTPVPTSWLLCSLPFVLIAVGFGYRRRGPRAALVLATTGIFLSAAASGGAARDRALHSDLRKWLDAEYGGFVLESQGPGGPHEPVAARFELTEDAAVAGDVVVLRARLEAVRLKEVWRPLAGEGVRLTVGGTITPARVLTWRAARTLEAPVTFRRQERFLDDGVPDFERDAVLDGIDLTGSVKSGLLVNVAARGSMFDEAAADVRAHVRNEVMRWVSPHDRAAAAVVIAVLIGDRTGLADDVRDRLQAAGTYHVIAISGGNIAILAGLLLGGVAIAGVRGRAAALIVILALMAYAQMVTAGPSVWRATVMAVLYLAARLVDHRTQPWHALAVAAGGMAAANPLDTRDPGFVLTFGATAALLAAARWATVKPAPSAALRRPRWWSAVVSRRWARWAAASIVASTAVEIVLMPVSAEAFSRVTIAGLALNLLAVPLMGVVQIAGTVVALAGFVDTIGRSAGWIAYVGAALLLDSARLVDLLPSLSWRVPPPGTMLIVVYYAGLAALLVRRRRVRLVGAATVLLAWAAIGAGAVTAVPALADRTLGLRATILDVGQAEAMVLETRGAGPIEIDAGGVPFGNGGFAVGSRVVAPALWARGILRLGTLLVTHGDPDHLGGGTSLLHDFRPGRLWTGIDVPRHEPTSALLEAARHAGVQLEQMRAGEERTWGKARIRVLSPPPPDWERQRVRNDDSVVLEITYGDVALLLTGDISSEVERDIAARLTPAPIRILKVAHHGSRTSTSQALLDAWRPQIAVISCGRGNRFGHPTHEVIARLEAIGARVLRTDLDGEITIDTDGRAVHVETFRAAHE